MERSGGGPFKELSLYLLSGIRKTWEDLIEDSRSKN
jgi:hypothetical protein